MGKGKNFMARPHGRKENLTVNIQLGKDYKKYWNEHLEEDEEGNLFDLRKEFLYNTLTALDNRRTAVDARSSVCLAISTTSLVLILSQYDKDSLLMPKSLFELIMYVFILLTLSISVLFSILLVAPIRKYNKPIKNKAIKNYSWFYAIARETKNEYINSIRNVQEKDILIELASQVYSISLLLDKRYNRLSVLCWFLNISLLLIMIYVLVIIFFRRII